MDINKAIKKQNKAFIRFSLLMSFIFFTLPIILYIAKCYTTFIVAYLLIIEGIIIFSIAYKANSQYLEVENKNYKIVFKVGFLGKRTYFLCDKIVMVKAESKGKSVKLTLIASSDFRNKSFNKVDNKFLERNSELEKAYENMTKLGSEEMFYYIQIESSSLKMFSLLKLIYRSCVYAFFTEETIDCLKKIEVK